MNIEQKIEAQRKRLVALGLLPPTPARFTVPPGQSSSPGGADILAQFAAIKNATERTEFYRKNRGAFNSAWVAQKGSEIVWRKS